MIWLLDLLGQDVNPRHIEVHGIPASSLILIGQTRASVDRVVTPGKKRQTVCQREYTVQILDLSFTTLYRLML